MISLSLRLLAAHLFLKSKQMEVNYLLMDQPPDPKPEKYQIKHYCKMICCIWVYYKNGMHLIGFYNDEKLTFQLTDCT